MTPLQFQTLGDQPLYIYQPTAIIGATVVQRNMGGQVYNLTLLIIANSEPQLVMETPGQVLEKLNEWICSGYVNEAQP